MTVNVFLLARELCRHFDRFIVSTTSEATADAFREEFPGIETRVWANDSYDIGLFYKAWSSLPEDDRAKVSRLGFVNDSNKILCRLDGVFAWADIVGADFWGLTDSLEIRYHYQSSFLVFEKRAIGCLESLFEACGVATVWPKIKDKRKLRQEVIHEFETKLTALMMQNGMSIAVYTPCVNMGIVRNPTIVNARLMVALGHPMIKRQIPGADDLAAWCLVDGELQCAEVARANAFRRER